MQPHTTQRRWNGLSKELSVAALVLFLCQAALSQEVRPSQEASRRQPGSRAAAQAQTGTKGMTDADVPLPPATEEAEKEEVPIYAQRRYEIWKDAELNEAVARESAKYRIDPLLIHALIAQESGGSRRAVSYKGAAGPMQLMPATARRFGVVDRSSPRESVRGGLAYLNWLLERYNGNVALALAGYNAGEGAVDRYRTIPPYAETQKYVKAIAARYMALKRKAQHAETRSNIAKAEQ